MKVRKLTDSGDYRLGHGDRDFYVDAAEGVVQNVKTRLALWQGIDPRARLGFSKSLASTLLSIRSLSQES